MEVSALKYHGGLGLHARSPLLRLQSDERLIALIRRGNSAAFEVLVSRYESRLLAFCRHLLGSREDAEDVLQEVLAAAFNAMLADDRPIKVRPWLYRIARNRSLNHLRRNTAIGVDSMDVHLSDNGASTADKVHSREEFRLLLGDIQDLPETQRTALVLREMDALSYEQIAETMETTVPSVKSLLVRARVSLAEAAEARLLSCDQVRLELGEVAEGLKRRPSAPVRRHLRTCERCSTFRVQLRDTNKALAALLPFGPLALLKQFAFIHVGHSAGSGATAATSAAGTGASAGGGAAAGTTAAASSTAVAGSTAAAGSSAVAGSTAVAGSAVAATSGATGFVSAGIGAVATKAVAGIAAAALVTAGAVEVGGSGRGHLRRSASASVVGGAPIAPPSAPTHATRQKKKANQKPAAKPTTKTTTAPAATTPTTTTPTKTTPTTTATTATTASQTLVTTDPTHCQIPASGGTSVAGQGAPASHNICAPATTTTTPPTPTTTTTTPLPSNCTPQANGTDTTPTQTTPTNPTPTTTTSENATTPPTCSGTPASP
jgi:RNA polymerase sigma factor (sigma-70 family)